MYVHIYMSTGSGGGGICIQSIQRHEQPLHLGAQAVRMRTTACARLSLSSYSVLHLSALAACVRETAQAPMFLIFIWYLLI